MSMYTIQKQYISIGNNTNMEKDAANAFGKIYSGAKQKAQSAYKAFRQPGSIKNWAKRHVPELIGAGTLGAGGAYIGNKLYESSIPDVRTLPGLDMPPILDQK